MSKDFLKKAKNNPHQVSRDGEGKYSTELWAEEAVNNIEDRANSSQPWFLQVGVGELLFFCDLCSRWRSLHLGRLTRYGGICAFINTTCTF